MTWLKDLLGKKIEVKVPPGGELDKLIGGFAGSGGSGLASSATPPPVLPGPTPPYAVDMTRYRQLSAGIGTEVATLHPSEVRSSYVRQAYVMMSLMLPDSARNTVEIRHSFRPNPERGGLMYLETWMVRTYLRADWGTVVGGTVTIQWMWRDQQWTQFSVYEYSPVTRESNTLWIERVQCDDSNEAAVHHGAFTGLMDFFTEQGA